MRKATIAIFLDPHIIAAIFLFYLISSSLEGLKDQDVIFFIQGQMNSFESQAGSWSIKTPKLIQEGSL